MGRVKPTGTGAAFAANVFQFKVKVFQCLVYPFNMIIVVMLRSQDQHRIPKTKEPIFVLDRNFIGAQRFLSSDKCTYQHE